LKQTTYLLKENLKITLTPFYISFSGGIHITIKGKGFLDVGEVHVHNVVSYRSHQMNVV